MLVIVSDLHLTDGTSGTTIDEDAFKIFQERLTDLAWGASTQTGKDGKEYYKPIKEVELLLLGDILDVIRSDRWSKDDHVHPWTDPSDPTFVNKVGEITRAILAKNDKALGIFQSLANPGLDVPSDRARNEKPVKVKVKIYYLAGNHDWFFHLEGPGFDAIRHDVIKAMGLAYKEDKVFPRDTKELDEVFGNVCGKYHVFARHGDIYDENNYEPSGRDQASLGDAVAVELLNKFPHEVEDLSRRVAAKDAPQELVEQLQTIATGLKEIDNVRPVDLVPKFVDSLVERTPGPEEGRKLVRETWDEVAKAFLRDRFVTQRSSLLRLINPFAKRRSKLSLALRLSTGFSFRFLGKYVPSMKNWLLSLGNLPGGRKRLLRWGLSDDYSEYAHTEKAFNESEISYIVYGHTHRHEIVPLRTAVGADKSDESIYLNAGTWRAVYDLARYSSNGDEFFGYHVMTYLAFFKEGEHKGKAFETWSGSLEGPMELIAPTGTAARPSTGLPPSTKAA